MVKIKDFFVKYKTLIIISTVLLICSIAIAFGVYAQITKKGKAKPEESINYNELKRDFNNIFTNTINKQETAKQDYNYEELVFTRYDLKEEVNGKYSVEAKIPGFKEDNSKVLKGVNKEIYNTFAVEILKIVRNTVSNTKFNLDYTVYANNNIVSLVIMCKYKKGTNPQRKIVQTFNYDIDNDKLLSLEEILEYKNLEKNDVQNKIDEEIKKINNQTQSINNEGYNLYMRDVNSDIYKVENTQTFFLGKNNYLYLVYAYGNNDYTSEIDLIIF